MGAEASQETFAVAGPSRRLPPPVWPNPKVTKAAGDRMANVWRFQVEISTWFNIHAALSTSWANYHASPTLKSQGLVMGCNVRSKDSRPQETSQK
jgi:hypothetical protein